MRTAARVRQRSATNLSKLPRLRTLAAVLNAPKPYGHGMSLDPNAAVSVEWASPIVPVSEEEQLDTIIKEVEAGFRSQLEAILFLRGWPTDEEGREMAQKVLDEIGASMTATRPRSALDEALAGEGLA